MKHRVASLVLVLVLAASASSAAGDQAAPFRIHVRASAEAPQYATTQEVAEATAAVKKSLAGMKEFTVLEDPAAAEVVLTIADRREGGRPAGYLGAHGAADTRTGTGGFDPGRMVERPELWIRSTLAVGGRETEIYGSSSASWGTSAKELAKDVRKWLKKNAAQVRPQGGTPALPSPPAGTPPR